MGRPMGVAPLLAIWLTLGLGLSLSPWRSLADAADGPPGAADKPSAAKVASKTKSKTGSQTKSRRTTGKRTAGTHGKSTASHRFHSAHPAHPARTRTAQAEASTINDNIEITPFPSHAAEARKALAQNRREQLDDAEKAARDPHQEDRWQTVLFYLRGFDSRSDAEACFWRVIAYYRLGQIGRARTVRQSCDLPAKDQPLVEQEDILSAGLQPAAALPELAAAGDRPEPPVPNPAGYAGAGPTRLER
jgi:hypothetical protein